MLRPTSGEAGLSCEIDITTEEYHHQCHLRLLGKFAEAQKDLATACKIDFDEAADEWLKEVS